MSDDVVSNTDGVDDDGEHSGSGDDVADRSNPVVIVSSFVVSFGVLVCFEFEIFTAGEDVDVVCWPFVATRVRNNNLSLFSTNV